MQALKRRIIYFIWALIIAFSFFLFSYAFIFQVVAHENQAASALLNSAVIIFFLVLGKVDDRVTAKLKASSKKEKTGVHSRLKSFYFRTPDVSIKTALYLFYIALLVCSSIVTVDPDFPVLRNMIDYFQSVQYGILILIATDAFLEQMFKDETSNKST